MLYFTYILSGCAECSRDTVLRINKFAMYLSRLTLRYIIGNIYNVRICIYIYKRETGVYVCMCVYIYIHIYVSQLTPIDDRKTVKGRQSRSDSIFKCTVKSVVV